MADQKNQETEPEANPSSSAIQSHPPGVQSSGITILPATSSSTVPVAAATAPASLERMDILLLMLLLLLAFLIGSFAAANSDVWLHLASGRLVAQGEWTIGVDPFSFASEATATHPAVTWVHQSWLFSLLFYLLYNIVGGAGLVVLKALATVALAWCLLQIPGGKRARILSVIYVGLAVLAISPQLILRPMTVSLLFFGISLLICYRAGALGHVAANPRVLWRLPLLFLLWANLDAWFIMGPLLLALLWVGTGMAAALGVPRSFPGKTLGAVLGVGLLACLINPHHVYVFMLPPELAYLVVRVINVPDFLGAGGYALRNLQQVDSNYYPMASPLPLESWPGPYWRSASPGGGQNIAGLAYIPLVLLGLISFVVNAVVTKKPGAPGLHPGRFILWVFLACLSLIQVRLIPWFAIVSAPITVLNVMDWRTWLTNIQLPNWRPAQFGRAWTVLVFLLLIFLAWPGWLNAPLGDFSSARRVAWEMPVDPSFYGATRHLTEINDDGQGLRVFNISPEIAHYCAWYAPGVKCFVDSRWPLFREEAARAAKTRMGLAANEPEAWQKTFVDHNVNYLALTRFQSRVSTGLQLFREAGIAEKLWVDQAHWRQKYGDGKTLVFAWSGPEKIFAADYRSELNRRAFGKVPSDQRAPAQVPAWPQEEPSVWSQYWQAPPPLPLAAYEANYWLRYYQFTGLSWQKTFSWVNAFSMVSQIARGAEPAGLGNLSVTLPYAAGTMMFIPRKIYGIRVPNGNIFLKARDFGPSAEPLLMTRCARRAVAENPNDPLVYLVLSEMYKTLNNQEEHWANYLGEPGRRGRRYSMRQIQIMTAYKTYLALKPEDAEIHETVGKIFLQMRFFDVAMDHLQKAAKYADLNSPATSDPKFLEIIKTRKAESDKLVRSLEEEVKKRRESYGLEVASKKGLDKYKPAMDRGLAQEALDQLANLKEQGLSPEEKGARQFRLIE
ncbi:MAG TPA: hypothetical protein VNX28_00985, partial [Gemmataceae bacterium]|nr:hypothetical protein [Gemmataceae bacterium]